MFAYIGALFTMSTSASTSIAAGDFAGAAMHINNPREFLAVPGEPPVAWSDWKEYFLNYIANLEDLSGSFSPERKKECLCYV